MTLVPLTVPVTVHQVARGSDRGHDPRPRLLCDSLLVYSAIASAALRKVEQELATPPKQRTQRAVRLGEPRRIDAQGLAGFGPDGCRVEA
jgi:hypothetical protein